MTNAACLASCHAYRWGHEGSTMRGQLGLTFLLPFRRPRRRPRPAATRHHEGREPVRRTGGIWLYVAVVAELPADEQRNPLSRRRPGGGCRRPPSAPTRPERLSRQPGRGMLAPGRSAAPPTRPSTIGRKPSLGNGTSCGSTGMPWSRSTLPTGGARPRRCAYSPVEWGFRRSIPRAPGPRNQMQDL